MKTVTKTIIGAFLDRKPKTLNNTSTDGQSLFLFGNKIAEHRPDGVWFTLAGWPTVTTRDRLNALGARLHQVNFVTCLNGQPVDAWKWYKL